jgi:hypothetical protein
LANTNYFAPNEREWLSVRGGEIFGRGYVLLFCFGQFQSKGNGKDAEDRAVKLTVRKGKEATAQKVAGETGMSVRTVRRAGKFAEAVAALERLLPKVAEMVRRGEVWAGGDGAGSGNLPRVIFGAENNSPTHSSFGTPPPADSFLLFKDTSFFTRSCWRRRELNPRPRRRRHRRLQA